MIGTAAPEATGSLPRSAAAQPPKLGFLGVGWIGLNRLQALAQAGVAKIAAVADSSAEMIGRAKAIAPQARVAESADALLAADLDGLVVATPSAMHAAQSIAALDRQMAVFCQKPVGRTASETRAVIAAARRANRLFGVDLSYRELSGAKRIREIIRSGELGDIYAIEMAFHNAYGPDKAWFYDRKLSGGGCVIDLGIHLIDLALWALDFPEVLRATSRLFAQGAPWRAERHGVEDYATARIDLSTGATVQLACSWKLPAGRDAVIDACFYGAKGGVALHNVNGSFYEFVAERYRGTAREILSSGLEDWGGRAAVQWARDLRQSGEFRPESEEIIKVAEALDLIYAEQSS